MPNNIWTTSRRDEHPVYIVYSVWIQISGNCGSTDITTFHELNIPLNLKKYVTEPTQDIKYLGLRISAIKTCLYLQPRRAMELFRVPASFE